MLRPVALVALSALVGLAAGCSHPPPPAPPAVQHPVAHANDVAGRWVTSDSMDFGYELTISPAGVFDLWIDRNRMGRCEEKGPLTGGASGKFSLTYQRNDCDRTQIGRTTAVEVTSYTGKALTIRIGGDARTYQRAPAQ